MSDRKRIVVWGTGVVGSMVLAEILSSGDGGHPVFELVGVGVSTPAKVGRDAGELAGLDTVTGVLATDDVDALVVLEPTRWSTTAPRRSTPTTTSGSSAPSCAPGSTSARPP
jgi:hypothetical protein